MSQRGLQRDALRGGSLDRDQTHREEVPLRQLAANLLVVLLVLQLHQDRNLVRSGEPDLEHNQGVFVNGTNDPDVVTQIKFQCDSKVVDP